MAFCGTHFTDPAVDRTRVLSTYNSLVERSSAFSKAGMLPVWLYKLLNRKGDTGYNLIDFLIDQVASVVESVRTGNLPLEAYTDERNGLFRRILQRI